jgi:hypothetical protein
VVAAFAQDRCDGPSRTRVELEHRGLEAFGEKMGEMRASLDSPGGWAGILESFAASAATA